ncbi:MAG TPA: peptidylprolyl isomerase [Kiritimatiellia bacterium]|nr:peptidylprolyl isomerase [Kiritimatiellia bacterium]HSA16836.1 peptidylprolyl isomerase [Kiritimatiellia bacterium]
MMRSILAPFGLFLVLGFAAKAQPPAEPPAAPGETPAPPPEAAPAAAPRVKLQTSMGDIVLELDPAKAPLSVENFLKYVDDGHYNGTIFHRVINGFMIQGGGFTRNMQQKPTRGPVRNEADNGLKNARGTIAMARTSDPHSATAQFFISVVDNASLDHTSPDPRGYGYCVFGRVVEGLDVVDKIKAVQTTQRGPFADVPAEPIEIVEAKRQ